MVMGGSTASFRLKQKMDIGCLIHNCLTPDIERVPTPRYRRGNDDATQTPYWGAWLLLNYDVDQIEKDSDGKKELERINNLS